MKFRTRLSLAFALLALLLVVADLVHSYLRTTNHDKQVAIRSLTAASSQANRGINLLIRECRRDMEVIARSAFLNEPGRSRESINHRLADFRNGSGPMERLSFITPDGRVAADSGSMDLDLQNRNEAWQQGMAGRQGFLIHTDQQDNVAELRFYAPVRLSPTAAPRGVIIGTVPLHQIRQLIGGFEQYPLTGPERVRIELIDQHGHKIYSSDGKAGLLSADLQMQRSTVRPTPLLPEAVSDTGANLQLLTLTEALSTPDNTWYLRVTAPKAQIFAEARHRLQIKALLACMLLFAGILITRRVAGLLSRPLESLSQAIQQLGEGDGSALAQLPRRHDEFALLQESLQQMSRNLGESLERLTASEEQFHALFDAMAEGAVLHRMLYDQEGIPSNYLVEEVNLSYQEILGLSREEVLGKPATEVYRSAYPPYLQEYATVVATGQACSFESYVAGFERHFRISACRIGPERFATVFTDITAQKWHEETLRNTMNQLKEANEAKSRFLAVMSHEIRTPLNGISGMVQLLRDMEMPPLQREFLDNIDTSAESLLSVINDILDFSKIEAGRMELEAVAFQPLKLLNDNLRVMRLRAQAKGLLLSLVYDDTLPAALLGDPHRIAQVLTNLVNNAIKFTASGEITVRVGCKRIDDDTVLCSFAVKDSGIGMDEMTQKTIFEPFIQADSSTTRKYGGTGLGLAICRQLVELMNGSISVSSSPGQGSTFSFTVPLKRGEVPEAAVEEAEEGEGSIDRALRILVAEDQPINQRFVAEILRKKGHTPLLAANGQEALELWQQEPVDLVLMDIQMPVMDGLKALAAIRAHEDVTRRHTPIVALTAHAIVGDRERLLNAGFDGYLPKPLQVASLFEEMARVMEHIRKEKHA